MNQKFFNEKAAGILRECAALLREQAANPFRINAYIHAAQTLESMPDDVRIILREKGIDGLVELPSIGSGLAAAIAEIAQTGRLSRLDRLRGSANPEILFQSVPGVGPTLAKTIHESLEVDSLEALEVAANDGRLDTVNGIGPRRAAAVRAGLASLLGRASVARRTAGQLPSVKVLLDIDEEYRRKVADDSLQKIAPRRFNPEAQAWLPIMHADREPWHFTALFSNTARAHQFNRTNDWVVVYYHDDDHREGQCTIVTETQGPMEGKRVVRGREAECRREHG